MSSELITPGAEVNTRTRHCVLITGFVFLFLVSISVFLLHFYTELTASVAAQCTLDLNEEVSAAALQSNDNDFTPGMSEEGICEWSAPQELGGCTRRWQQARGG